MKVGDRVRVKGVPAHVRFIGPTQFSTGEWIGVEMVEGQGNNDGSVQGVRYFECKGTSGKFVRRPQVETDADLMPPPEVPRPSQRPQSAMSDVSDSSTALAKQVESLKAKLRVTDSKRKLEREQIQQLQTDLREKKKLETIVAKLESKLRPLSDEVKQLRADLTKTSNEHAHAKVKLEQHEDALEMATLDREMAEEKLEIAKREMEELRQELNVPSERIDSADEAAIQRNAQLEAALVSLRDYSTAQEASLNEQIKQLNSKLTDYSLTQSQLESSEKRLEETQATLHELRAQLDDVMVSETLIDSLTEKNLALTESVEKLQATVAELEELKELNDELEAGHVATQKQLHQEIAYLESELNHAEKRTNDAHNRQQNLEQSVMRFREVVADLQAEIELWETKHREKQHDNESMVSHVKTVMEMNQKLQSSVASTRNQEIALEMEKLSSQQALDKLAIWHYFLTAAESPITIPGSDVDVVVSAHLRFKRTAALLSIIVETILGADYDETSVEEQQLRLALKLAHVSALAHTLATLLEWRPDVDAPFLHGESEQLEQSVNSYIDTVSEGALLVDEAVNMVPVFIQTFDDFLSTQTDYNRTYLDMSKLAIHTRVSILLLKQLGHRSCANSLSKLKYWIDNQDKTARVPSPIIDNAVQTLSDVSVFAMQLLHDDDPDSAYTAIFKRSSSKPLSAVEKDIIKLTEQLSTLDFSVSQNNDLPTWAQLQPRQSQEESIVDTSADVLHLKAVLLKKEKTIETLEIKIKHYDSKAERFAEKEEAFVQLRANLNEAALTEKRLRDDVESLKAKLEQKNADAQRFKTHVQNRLKLSTLKGEDIVDMHLNTLHQSQMETELQSLRQTVRHLTLENSKGRDDLDWMEDLKPPIVKAHPYLPLKTQAAFHQLQKLAQAATPLKLDDNPTGWRPRNQLSKHVAAQQRLQFERYQAMLLE
ncbi:dynein associated protein-domain-containing protein [Yarrowia lipolytica]|jgi:dynactin 1|uniref:Uncharacterized protein n=1 Tax=Yarrowia lipolytica TaxID=4952 RepID=A0A1H6PWP0_YARLL|nr:hypothetical protein YALI1_A21550g [Yarrowia lipolytica]KAJ8051876.1 dynein associated protein-domain-containing protein [Yarrowia lipolytica]QNP95369.1 Dynactin [Yarrowia lipolytica]SEI36037.1 YALIA101S09e04544g1_1 [Yarrowia lipolytica]VBB87439.1 Conserved hypothetical protein [Yarrowia lipolytica]